MEARPAADTAGLRPRGAGGRRFHPGPVLPGWRDHRAGGAARLPTWRIENAWTRRLFGARAITGYHLYFQIFVAVMAHLPYLIGVAAPRWAVELRILAFLVLFWVLEDFLWFVFNPAYGLGRFRRETVWWHAQTWWGFMPRDYWLFLPVGVALYVLSWAVG